MSIYTHNSHGIVLKNKMRLQVKSYMSISLVQLYNSLLKNATACSELFMETHLANITFVFIKISSET